MLSRVGESDGQGRLTGLLGLSQGRHPHTFVVDGNRLTTWCAWDGLFLPPLLGKPAQVESFCPAAGEPIRLEVGPDGVFWADRPGVALSMVKPADVVDDLRSDDEIRCGFCCFVHFFVSSKVAADWIHARSEDLTVLSVEEGFRLGRLVFHEFRKPAA